MTTIRSTAAIVASAGLAAAASAQITGPSTVQSPYMLPSNLASGVRTISLISNGNGTQTPNETYRRLNTGANDYRLVGIPDGMGMFQDEEDLRNGTFTLLVNHELGDNQGIVRDHGSRGAFMSKWRLNANANNLSVVGGQDLATEVKLWDIANNRFNTYNTANPMPKYQQGSTFGTQGWNFTNPNRDGIGRHCSGDLAPVSAYSWNGLGTTDRFYMNGEEIGAPGRAFAQIATGAEAGSVVELPRLGDFSWENSVASPFAQQKTVVMGTDDSGTGGVYMYVGNKQANGSVVDKAGLTNGNLYGLRIADIGTGSGGLPSESRSLVLGNSTVGRRDSARFEMYNFSDVTNIPGSNSTPAPNFGLGLQQIGDANQVVNFLRPEDGAWDTTRPNRFYFVTTDNVTSAGGRSRIYAMDYDSITAPEAGGTITMLADSGEVSSMSGGVFSSTGATTFEMADNFCMTKNGYLLIQEDVGSDARLGRLWLFDPFNDSMIEIGINDATRFAPGGSNFLTTNEETSGIISAEDTLGEGWFLLNMQAHYGIAGELVEGGQVMALFIPQTIPTPGAMSLLGLAGVVIARRRRA